HELELVCVLQAGPRFCAIDCARCQLRGVLSEEARHLGWCERAEKSRALCPLFPHLVAPRQTGKDERSAKWPCRRHVRLGKLLCYERNQSRGTRIQGAVRKCQQPG